MYSLNSRPPERVFSESGGIGGFPYGVHRGNADHGETRPVAAPIK